MACARVRSVCVKLTTEPLGGRFRGSVDAGNCCNCSAPRSCLRGNKGSSTGGESLPRGMSGAPVACALFPLGSIERLTPRDPALDANMCNSVDLSAWKRRSVYLQEQGWIVSQVIAKLRGRVYRLSLLGLWGDECALGAMQPLFHSSVYNLCCGRCVEMKTSLSYTQFSIMSVLCRVSSLSLLLRH